MKYLIVSALFLLPGTDTECRGCKAIEQPVQAIPPTVSVPYSFEGRGRLGLKFEAGKCTDAANGGEGCDAVACKLSGTLKVKNTSSGPSARELDVRVRGGSPARVQVKPGETTTITFGDPTTGQPARISCGADFWIELSAQSTDQNGRLIEATRRFCWSCTTCDKVTVLE